MNKENDRSRLQTTFMGVTTSSHSPTSIYLVNGIRLRGVIAAEDAFCVLVVDSGRAHLVYKHAISAIMPERPVDLRDKDDTAETQKPKETKAIRKPHSFPRPHTWRSREE